MDKKFAGSLAVFAIILIGGVGMTAAGQVIDESQVDEQLANLRRVERNAHDEDRRFRSGAQGVRITYLPPDVRAKMLNRMESMSLGGHRELILPPESYFSQYAAFLREDKTGLARIFPDQKCDRGEVVDVAELKRCADVLPIHGNGSYYSFRNRTNLNNKTWADIHFTDDKLVAGSETEFGIISEIGEMALESLTIKSKEVTFLKDYKPVNEPSEIKWEKGIFGKGSTENGVRYALSAPVKINSTYVLRAVAYGLETVNPIDNRIDIIVAFKVVSREPDGSLILLWKQLRSTASRRLK